MKAVPFIEAHRNSDNIAISSDSGSLSYRALYQQVCERHKVLTEQQRVDRPLAIIFMTSSPTSVVDYLAALSAGYVILLLSHNASADISNRYRRALAPDLVLCNGQIEWQEQTTSHFDERVQLLLSTSGSTGAGKCVALSMQNLLANCTSICAYLPIRKTDRTLLTMPLSYSYGLSVLHTHLASGAEVVFSQTTPFDKSFWTLLEDKAISSLSGVPSFYEMLLRLRLDRKELPALRYFTQAGGRLSVQKIKVLADYADKNGKQFFVMYGQTEATARMAFVPPSDISSHCDVIGKAIPGGELQLRNEAGIIISEPGVTGQLFYRGENVMLGYVTERTDLKRFSPHEWLATGDLAIKKIDGMFRITGRLKRIIKIAGERVCLDTVESALSDESLAIHCTGTDDQLRVFCLRANLDNAQQRVSTSVSLPQRVIAFCTVEQWPLLSNGKIDYQSLDQIFNQEKGE